MQDLVTRLAFKEEIPDRYCSSQHIKIALVSINSWAHTDILGLFSQHDKNGIPTALTVTLLLDSVSADTIIKEN